METKEYRTVDKSTWMRGPWDSEPDKKQWADEVTGLPCLIYRSNGGALCGYVGVTEGHPLFKKDYDDCPDLEVHGGLTYADLCQPHEDESIGVCHVPSEGEPDQVWWFGFDCAHHGDVSPAWASTSSLFAEGQYRDLEYVTNEITGLAAQIKAAA